ncbi:MAG TPA: hypothetical protein VJ547_02725 [Candidatus Thermoplasmatota archaeon]|nr:hypothetical protein [Candidatus Thermoplasmatota archaeon]
MLTGAPRAAAIFAVAAMLAPLCVSLQAAAVPGELTIRVTTAAPFANVNNSGVYPLNFSVPIEISLTSTGLRTFSGSLQFRYNVSLSESPEAAEGWTLFGPQSLTYEVPARGSADFSIIADGTVSENGSANNETLVEIQYNTQSNAPLTSGGVGTVSVVMFLADAPMDDGGTGQSGGGGFLGSGAAAAVGTVVAVAAVAVVVGVVFHQRRGKKVPGVDLFRKLWQRVRGLVPKRRPVG